MTFSRRACLFALFVIVGAVPGDAPAGAGVPADGVAERRIDAVVASVFARTGYQETLPDPPAAEPQQTRPLAPPPDWLLRLRQVMTEVLRPLGWVILAATLIVAAVWVIGRMRFGFGGRGRRPPVEPSAAPGDSAAPCPVDQTADALAAAGRFGEAIHVLLLGALDHLARRLGALAPSATSREVAHAAAGPDGAAPPAVAASLHDLVHAVERSRFAGRPAGAEAYARCRASYAVVVTAWPRSP